MNPLSLRKRLGGWLGEVIVRLNPGLLQETERLLSPTTLRHRLAKAAVYRRAVLANQESALGNLHRQYWTTDAAEGFYQHIDTRAMTHLLENHREMIDWLAELLKDRPGQFRMFCEFGCGNGRVLDYLFRELRAPLAFVGVDLSARQIARTQETYRNTSLKFVSGDGLEWLESQAEAGLVLNANGGVFEYFTEDRLRRVFQLLASRPGPSAIALIEPLSEDYNLANEERSRPYGSELTFSHNYPALARQAGLQILHQQDAVHPFGRRLMLLASTPQKSR